MFERFLALKPALVEMQSQQQYRNRHKVLSKIKERDWGLMSNVVAVLKVFFPKLGFNLQHLITYQVFYEVTLQLSHASACISEVLNTFYVIFKVIFRFSPVLLCW